MRDFAEGAYISIDDYLKSEAHSPIRREYVDGQVFDMTGSSLKHNQIVKNLSSAIDRHIKGSGCRSFILDIKVRVEATNSFYYPDLVVSCAVAEMTDVFLREPTLIVEVLSPSTAAIDRREKLLAYRQIGSLQEYAIVYQSLNRVDVFGREANFKRARVYAEAHVILNSLPNGPLTISLDELYADTIWGEPGPENDPWRVSECVGALEW